MMKRKRWMIFAAIAVVLFAALAIAKAEIKKRLSLPAIEGEVSKALDLTVAAKDFSVTWTGEVDIENLRISDKGKEFMDAGQARISVSLWNLLKRNVVVKSIVLFKPSLRLDENLIRALSLKFKKKSGVSREFPLYMEHGTLAYTSSNGKTISVGDLAGSITVSGNAFPVRLSFRGSGGGTYSLTGTVGKDRIDLKGELRDVSLGEVVNPFGKVPVSSFSGMINGRYTLSGIPSRLHLESQANVGAPLFHGSVRLSGDLTDRPTGMIFRGNLASQGGNLEGIGAFRSLSLDFEVSRAGMLFKKGMLSLRGGIVSLSGKVGEKNALLVNLASGDFNPFLLASLQGLGITGAGGRFSGSASGVFPALRIRAVGSLPQARLGTRVLNKLRLSVTAHSTAGHVFFDKIGGEANGVPFALAADAAWGKTGDVRIRFSRLDVGSLAAMFHLPKAVNPIRMVVAGEAMYQEAGAWAGTAESPGGAVAGIPFDAFSAKFSNPKNGPLIFSGRFFVSGIQPSFRGEWKKGSGLETTFTIPGGRYGARTLPDTTGTVRMKGTTVYFSPISFPMLHPPLILSGSYDVESGVANFQSHLNGQDPSAFLSFVPMHLPPMRGNLFGDLTVSGSYPRFSVSFSGSVRNARFQSFLIPQGNLSLSGTLPDRVSIRFHTDQFTLGSLEMIRQFVPLGGTGSLDVASQGLASGITVSFNFPNTTLSGEPLGALSGLMRYRSGVVRVERLRVPITAPPVNVTGTVILSRHSIDLHSILNGERLANLSRLAGKNAPAVDGRLYGTVALRGTPGKAYLEFNGRAEDLSYSGKGLGSASLSGKISPSETGFHVAIHAGGILIAKLSMLQDSLPGLSGILSLDLAKSGAEAPRITFHLQDLSLKGKRFPPVSGNIVWESPVASISDLNLASLSPPLSARGQVNTDTRVFRFDASLAGQRIGELLKFSPSSLPSIDAKFFGPVTVSGDANGISLDFSGTLSDVAFEGKSFGRGHADIKAGMDAQKKLKATLSGSGFQAAGIGFLSERYPGIRGDVNFNVNYGSPAPGQATLDISLKDATLRGKAFPRLAAHGIWNDPVFLIQPFSAPGLNPPLTLNGSMNTGSKNVEMRGQLNGQAIPDLMMLGGGSAAGINGNLFGPLIISGPYTATVVRFSGTVRNLNYHGLSLGNGSLSLVESSRSVDGKLTLDNPIYLGADRSLIGAAISSIPGIGGAYSQFAQNKMVTGVVIRGNPKNPEVKLEMREVPGSPSSPPPPRRVRPSPNPSNNNPINNILQQIFKGAAGH